MPAAVARRAALALLLALVAGCAQHGGWHKDGVSAEDLNRDRVDCRRHADAQAEREAFHGGAHAPVYELDRNSGQIREAFETERRSAALREKARAQQLFEDCMKTRGYRAE